MLTKAKRDAKTKIFFLREQKREKLSFYKDILELYEAQRRKKGAGVVSNDFVE